MTEQGTELKVFRIRAGLRQFEVARELNMTPSALSEIETGKRIVSEESIAEIKAAIDRLTLTKVGRA